MDKIMNNIKRRAGRPSKDINQMYDPLNLKKMYIEEQKIERKSQVYLYNIGDYEKILGKYCFKFTEEQMITYFLTLDSYNTYSSCLSCIRRFINWYNNRENLGGGLDLNKFGEKNNLNYKVRLNEIKQKIIISRKYLYDMINEICSKREKLVMILLYEGLCKEEILLLTISDFDEKSKTITLKDKVIHLDDIMEDIIIDAATDVSTIRNSYAADKFDKLYRVYNTNNKEDIKKRDRNIDGDIRNVKDALARQCKYAYKCLEALNINKSGLFEHVFMCEQQGKTVNKDDFTKSMKQYNIRDSYYIVYELYKVYKEYLFESGTEMFTDYSMEYIQREFRFEKGVPPKEKKGENKFQSPWVEPRIKRGETGEKVVEELLKKSEDVQVSYKVLDKYGYDLYSKTEVREAYIEVKTLHLVNSMFYMSIQELRSSSKYLEDYYLYLVILPEGEEKFTEILRVKNPYATLRLNNNILKNYIDRDISVPFGIESISLKLPEIMINNKEMLKWDLKTM